MVHPKPCPRKVGSLGRWQDVLMPHGHDEIAGYWNNYADVYDQAPDHGLGDLATREAWRVLLELWLPARPSDVADLACGTGSLTALVAGLGHRVVGVDLAGNMVDRARITSTLPGSIGGTDTSPCLIVTRSANSAVLALARSTMLP